MGDATSRVLVVEADGVVCDGPAYLLSVSVNATGAVIIYDNASAASGTKLWQGVGPGSHTFANPVRAVNGLYCDITANIATVEFTN